MKYEINFDSAMKSKMFINIYHAFDNTENCFIVNNLPRNIRNACDFSAQVAKLEMFGASVDAHGIYDDNGFDRIGYARINEHVFVKNGEFIFDELSKALDELVDGSPEDEAIDRRAEQEAEYDRFFEGQEEQRGVKMKWYVVKTTKTGVEYKKAKCLDTWSKSKEGCWKYSFQGAKQIAERLNAELNPYWRDKIHYNYIKAE